ncbi:MAG: HesA/MoeB/ThiF family protein [Pseudomonadota bacterium]
MSRYARQTILPEIGEVGQRRLAASTVLVIGAGGLGSPLLQYLAGAGVGQIKIVDPDRVETSNLHRQPLFSETMTGASKAEAACSVLGKLNSDIELIAINAHFDAGNAQALCEGVDAVFDCADSFAASYVASDTCLALGIPLISASALSLKGYVGGFCGGAPSMRAVFPDIPSNLATCATAGVMGPVVGALGAMQAQMGLSVLLGLEPSPLGQLVSFDASNFSFSGFRFDGAAEPQDIAFPFISAADIGANDYVVELRSEIEVREPITRSADRLIADDFANKRDMPADDKRRTVFVCRSGLRAWKAAKYLNTWWSGPIALVAAGAQQGETK